MITIGEILATIGLTFTFSELLPLGRKIRSSHRYKDFLLAGTASLSANLFAYVLPSCEFITNPYIQEPSVWQGISVAFIIAVVIQQLYNIAAPLGFSKYSAKKTSQEILHVVAMGSDKDFSDLANLLMPLISKLYYSSSKFDIYEKTRLEKENKKYFSSSDTVAASEIFFTLSDKSFCKLIACKRPDFIAQLYRAATVNNVQFAKVLIQNIICESINNKNSILFREQNYDGLGFSKALINQIFSNHELNEKIYPLSKWHFSSDNDHENLECYAKCFLKCIEQYFESKDFFQASFSIKTAGNTIFENQGLRFIDTENMERSEFWKSEPFKLFEVAVDTFTKAIGKMKDYVELETKELIEYSSKQSNHDYTIFNNFAQWAFDLLEAAAICPAKFEATIRLPLLDLWESIFTNEAASYQEVRIKLAKLISKRIDENFQGGYASIIRVLLIILGLENSKENPIHKKLLDSLVENFEDLYLADSLGATRHLPKHIEFDSSTTSLHDSRDVESFFSVRKPPKN